MDDRPAGLDGEPLLDEATQRKLAVVMPAFNEEEGIGGTLASLKARLPLAEIIVVDDGSSDATAAIAEGVKGVRVLRQPFNRGYGAGIKLGMRAARRDYVAWFDADNEHRVEDLAALVATLDAQNLAAVIGARPRGGPLVRTAGKAVLWLMARSLRFKVGSDLNCGLRVFRAAVIAPYLGLLPNGFSASMTSTLVLLERGYPLAFLPIRTEKRLGVSKVRLADGFATMLLTLRLVMLFAPLRVFVPGGFALFGGGALYGLVQAVVSGRGLSVAALFLLIAGGLLIMLELVADQISQLRLGQLETNALEAQRATDSASNRKRGKA